MSDLISKKSVVEFIQEEIKQDRPNDFKIRNIQRFIQDMPTAYSINNVVAELETLRIDKCNYFGVLNVVAEKYDRANEMLDDAIDIVRKGGVDE